MEKQLFWWVQVQFVIQAKDVVMDFGRLRFLFSATAVRKTHYPHLSLLIDSCGNIILPL